MRNAVAVGLLPPRFVLVLALGLLFPLAPRAARADEVIQLTDKTRIVGQLLHYYDGKVTVKLPNGTKLKLPKAKIWRIRFKLPKPRAALSTPKKTFRRLRKAALRGDVATYVDCHSTYYQMFLNHQIAASSARKFARRLKKEWGQVQLKVLRTSYKKGMATMRVRRSKGGRSQDGELLFVKENKEWKMVLPL